MWESEQPDDEVCLGDLAVGGNFVFYLIIVVRFIGFERAYRFGGILKLSSGGKPQRNGTIFMGEGAHQGTT